MANLLFLKGYKGLTFFQPLDDILFCLKSLGSVGTGEKRLAMELRDWENQRRADAVSAAQISLAIIIITDVASQRLASRRSASGHVSVKSNLGILELAIPLIGNALEFVIFTDVELQKRPPEDQILHKRQ
jgi:hypothetical protein